MRPDGCEKKQEEGGRCGVGTALLPRATESRPGQGGAPGGCHLKVVTQQWPKRSCAEAGGNTPGRARTGSRKHLSGLGDSAGGGRAQGWGSLTSFSQVPRPVLTCETGPDHLAGLPGREGLGPQAEAHPSGSGQAHKRDDCLASFLSAPPPTTAPTPLPTLGSILK